MAVPHFVFWPFDFGIPKAERERLRPKAHIADSLRVGALAQEEGAELRMEGHLMSCEFCRETAVSLWERVREKADPAPFVPRYSCSQTRNELFRHLEEGRPLPEAAVSHLRECVDCADHFLEPAKAQHTLTVDEEAVAAQD